MQQSCSAVACRRATRSKLQSSLMKPHHDRRSHFDKLSANGFGPVARSESLNRGRAGPVNTPTRPPLPAWRLPVNLRADLLCFSP